MIRFIKATHGDQIMASVLFAKGSNQPVVDHLDSIGDIPFEDGGFLKKIQFLREIQPDIVYGFGLQRIPWSILGRLSKTKVFIGAERNGIPRQLDIYSRKLDRYLLHGYIANTKFAATKLEHQVGVAADRIHVAYNGMDFAEDKIQPAVKKDSWGSPTLVCVANVHPRKGILYLVQAVAQLQDRFPGLRALLIGNDNTDGEFDKQAAEQGLSNTYQFLGFQSDVRPLLLAADLFVLPSIAIEGMPTSILEAMANRVPVVATDVGGTSELVLDQQTGLLCPPADPDSLATAIAKLLDSPELATELSNNAYTHVKTNHTVESMAESHMIAFRKILSR